MRLLITTHGGAGHFHPLAPIAEAARAAGHEVTFAVEPPFDAEISRAGFAVHAVGRHFDFTDPAGSFPELVERSGLDGAIWAMEHIFYGALAIAALPDVERLIGRWRPDVVLHESSEIAGLLAAERQGLAHAAFNYGGMDLRILRHVAGPAWDRRRAALGLAPDPMFDVMADSLVIALMPTAWAGGDSPANVLRVRLPAESPNGAIGGREVPLADGRRVYATLGTVNRDPAPLRDLVQALGQQDRPAPVTTGLVLDPADGGPAEDHVVVESYVAQPSALVGTALVVHHGGFNTMLGALRAGLPQVVLPMEADQPLNAARAEQLGFAVVVPPEERTAATITDAIDRASRDPELASEAIAMREQIEALEPIDAAVDALVRLAPSA